MRFLHKLTAWLGIPPDVARMMGLLGFTVLATLALQSVISCYRYERSPGGQATTFLQRVEQAWEHPGLPWSRRQ